MGAVDQRKIVRASSEAGPPSRLHSGPRALRTTPTEGSPSLLPLCDCPSVLSYAGVADLLANDKEEKLKIICAGVKCFERQDKDADIPCQYRLSQEGLQVTLPHITKQKVR
eukprot:4678945-Pyramimonas_sp.AAC.1